MAKLKDINFGGGKGVVCEKCSIAYMKFPGSKVGAYCPKCNGRLVLKELARGDNYYDVDERTM